MIMSNLSSDVAHNMSIDDTHTHCLMIMSTLSIDVAHNMSIDDAHTLSSNDAHFV